MERFTSTIAVLGLLAVIGPGLAVTRVGDRVCVPGGGTEMALGGGGACPARPGVALALLSGNGGKPVLPVDDVHAVKTAQTLNAMKIDRIGFPKK